MIYISKGIICKGKSKHGIFIRHFGRPMELVDEAADAWLKAQFGFVHVYSDEEAKAVHRLEKKGLVIVKDNYNEFALYDALCCCAICANPKNKFEIIPFKDTAKRVLIWLRKAGTNLLLPELVCFEEKGIEPIPSLLYRENSTALLLLIHPHCVSIAGSFENRMRNSVARKRTVDAILELLRRKRIVIM